MANSSSNKQAIGLQKYGAEFMQHMKLYPSLTKQERYPTLASACADDKAPSLVRLDNTYGKGAAEYWLSIQLSEVALFTGLRDKLSTYQLNALAQRLRELAYHVTLPEMMQFFTRFEQGLYEQFHGYEHPNPQVITSSFNTFLKELLEERGRQEERRKQDKREKEYQEMMKNAKPCPPHIAEKLKKLKEHFQETQPK